MKRWYVLVCVICSLVFSAGSVKANQADIDYEGLNLLPFNASRQLVLGELDHLGRATSAHIQLQDQDEPHKHREPRIKHDPVGWHNYQMSFGKQGKKAWLFNRGHLIGYQFSGLTDEGRNLVPLTAWTNSGNYKGVDEHNIEGMLYYEKRLDNWLALHPHYWLDYKVTPLYTDDELLPRQISLQYVGIDESGNLLTIDLGSSKETVDGNGITTLILDNYSKNATIDYLTGTAVPSLVPTEESDQATGSSSAVETPATATTQETQPAKTLAPVVYIARNGRSDVYWYSLDHMPSNTNFSKVIQMSEEEALNLGKRHTSKE